jgi:TonB family protein
VKWFKAVGLPLLYLAAVIWATRPPPPTYVSGDKTVVDVTDAGAPTLLHSPAPVYPPAALDKKVEGTVRLRVSVDDAGQVSKVEPVEGPPALVAAAVEAVRQWQFTAVAAETEIQVPFLLWHPGPHKVEPPAPVKRAPAFAGVGRHGTVRVVATLDETGHVESATAVTGPRHLLAAGERNLRRWVFRPQLEDGKPARGTFVTDVVF